MSDFKERSQALIALPVTKALIALLGILIIGVFFDGGGSFFKFNTHMEMLGFVSRYAILAFGMTLVIITGGIDLSVGSVLGLSAVAFSILTIHLGVPGYLALPICVAIGMGCGLISGTLIGKFKLQPFIVTLAMMVFARGAAKVLSGGQKVSTAVQIDGEYVFVEEPTIFETLSGKVFGDTVFTATLIAAFVAFLCWILLSRLRFGRYLYAIGGNEESARLSGIPVIKTKLIAYGVCGALAALAGVLQAAMETQGDPEAGIAYELQAIAIVVIGGTSLMGGSGAITLTVIGALIIGYLEKILSINAVPESYRLMLTGLIIVGAVLFQRNKRSN